MFHIRLSVSSNRTTNRILVGLMALTMLLPAAGAAENSPLPPDWSSAQLPHSLSFETGSVHTGQRYRIYIGLPHAPAPATGYPVLWMLDGAASFPLLEVSRPRPPRQDESAERRQRISDEPAGLIVAVGHANGNPYDMDARALDYTPVPHAPTGDMISRQHGGADKFLQFLTEELRPMIARHFPLDDKRHTLFGHSYGGLFTLHVMTTQPGHFQRYWASSPSLWFAGKQTLNTLPARLKALDFTHHAVKLTVTVGVDEQYPEQFSSPERQKRLQERTMVDNAERFVQLLAQQAGPGLQTRFMKVPAHDHLDMLLHGSRRAVEFAFAP